jgi:hypothetical protein
MGDTLAGGSKRPTARTAPPAATPAQPRSATQNSQERRRAAVIVCVMLLAAALTAGTVIALQSLISAHMTRSLQTATAMPDGDRTAKITRDVNGKECSQEIFDNQTGRMTKSQQPCGATALDSNGMPVPLGTIHRLDAISKSFSGR